MSNVKATASEVLGAFWLGSLVLMRRACRTSCAKCMLVWRARRNLSPAERIRYGLKLHEVTAGSVATRLHMAPSWLSDLERGKRRLTYKLAIQIEHLTHQPVWLFGSHVDGKRRHWVAR